MKIKTLRFLRTRLLRAWPAIGVFFVCLLLSVFLFFFYQKTVRENIIEKANGDAHAYRSMLQEGASAYVNLNRNAAAFFAASRNVTLGEFEKYVAILDVFGTYPGLSALGYIPRVPKSSVAGFEAAVRRIYPSFEIKSGQQDAADFYPFFHTFPQNERASQVRGLDHAGIPERWDAMQHARDFGKTVATKKHAALKDPLHRPVIFIYTPIYDSTKPIATIEQRRQALTGFVFSTFAIEDLIGNVMGPQFKALFDLEIYEGWRASQDQESVYDGDEVPHALSPEDAFAAVDLADIDFAGRNWLLYFFPKPGYFKQHDTRAGVLILSTGLLLSILLSALTWKWLQRRRAKRLEIEQAHRFQTVFENHPFAVYYLNPQRRIVHVNAKALEAFQLSKEELIGMPVEKIIVPENMGMARERWEEVLNGNAVTYDNTILNREGKRSELSIVMIPITSSAGKIVSALGIAQNITERKRAEAALFESRQMLQLVLDHIPQRVFCKDTESVYVMGNKTFADDAGLGSPQAIPGKTAYDMPWNAAAEKYRQDDLETMQSGIARLNYEEPERRTDGVEYWLRTSKIPLKNSEGQTVGVLGVYEDITEHKKLEQKLQQMAHYDSLTDLPNRAFFYQQLEQAISRRKRYGSLLALMYFDIDHFKRINDTYGHDVGDDVIRMFAQRVKSVLREIDILGRLGGDEFSLIVEDLSSRAAAELIATKIIEAMQPAFQFGDLSLQVSTSIGITFHEQEMTAEQLVKKADQAMYRAKQAGRNRFET